jgi:hypothetical protein
LADATIHPHLVIDRLTGSLKLLMMLVLSGVEQLVNDAVVQVDDFVGDGSHAFNGQRYQSGIASLHLKLGQVSGRHWIWRGSWYAWALEFSGCIRFVRRIQGCECIFGMIEAESIFFRARTLLGR